MNLIAPTQIQLSTSDKEKLKIILEMLKDVGKELLKGRSESVYQNAICNELQEHSITYSREEVIPILHKGKFVGHERADIIIDPTFLPIVLELKAVKMDITPQDIWQCLSYMRYKKFPYGIVINYNQSSYKGLEIKVIIVHNGNPYIYEMDSSIGCPIRDNLY